MNVWDRNKLRRSSFPFRKRSDNKLPILRPPGTKNPVAKSPSLPKRQLSPEPQGRGKGVGPGALQVPDEGQQQGVSRSLEDLDREHEEELTRKENGSGGGSDITDDVIDGPTSGNTETSKRQADMVKVQEKIDKIMLLIKEEQGTKETNVNEYLKVAGEADKQQLIRIKQVFEKKNQKSTASLSTMQKKLEKYKKVLSDIETYGSHRQPKDKLRDMGQGLKDVGANIVDGITGFSGGVVGNIKGAKESIVSKPREFAHLIKNKFGSADNIAALMHKIHQTLLETADENQHDDGEKSHGGGTLPAREINVASGGKSDEQTPSFKYLSDEENSSIAESGSGLGGHSSPPSNSANTSQQIVMSQLDFDALRAELRQTKDASNALREKLQQTLEEFESYKLDCKQETSVLRSLLEEERFKLERMEEQMNDIVELNQNEITNLKQDISGMEEKIEYRLEERTGDIHDLLENCQTRITKMELQQQQQQIISMEMVENVTFRTILTKLINVVLALLAVILVFVSTFANLLAPFLTTRARIVTTIVMITSFILSWNNWTHICDFLSYLLDNIRYLLPNR
ncbi:transmembrane and coiled-coil domains protein 2-like isoform X2 [Dreissena polymorpha]|uniref:transmembrane and coiled-coil domains protein 2-like isoform X2 n=1 Tax=Dreissena polymorpha TaxID=45954 RepID=UPI00226487CA|nr:transmembrane and coiled-coil domains protein 2-like isoform X2 [Dreissena polymorpha]